MGWARSCGTLIGVGMDHKGGGLGAEHLRAAHGAGRGGGGSRGTCGSGWGETRSSRCRELRQEDQKLFVKMRSFNSALCRSLAICRWT